MGLGTPRLSVVLSKARIPIDSAHVPVFQRVRKGVSVVRRGEKVPLHRREVAPARTTRNSPVVPDGSFDFMAVAAGNGRL